jgi:hypothetical protein
MQVPSSAGDSTNSKCIKCGADITPTAKFCPNCGAPHTFQPIDAAAPSLPSEEPSIKPEVIALSPDDGLQPSPPPESVAEKVMPKAGRIPLPLFILAGLIVVVVLVITNRNSEHLQSNQPATENSPQATTPPPRIITKDPELARLLHPPNGEDDILAYSKAYVQKKQEIEAKLAQVTDHELRARLASEEWGKVDKSSYFAEGEDNLRASLSAAMYSFLMKHRADWFEIGHVDYPGSGSLTVKSVEASPLEVPENESIALDITSMDSVYSKFREAARPAIQAGVEHWMDEQSCTAHLRNVCENLGGSPGECSDPAHLQEIEQRLGGGGILSGCNDNPSGEKGRQIMEKRERDNRLVLVGQGDLLAHRIDKLLIVDYDTETLLLELKPSILSGDIVWKFPADGQANDISLLKYKRAADADSAKDFGAVALHADSGKQTFHNNNDSDNPIQIVVSLQGDDDNSFVLENGCNLGAVEPHETCEFSVHFKPVHMGFHTAAIQIAGEGWSIHSVVLRGFGIWPWDTSH